MSLEIYLWKGFVTRTIQFVSLDLITIKFFLSFYCSFEIFCSSSIAKRKKKISLIDGVWNWIVCFFILLFRKKRTSFEKRRFQTAFWLITHLKSIGNCVHSIQTVLWNFYVFFRLHVLFFFLFFFWLNYLYLFEIFPCFYDFNFS